MKNNIFYLLALTMLLSSCVQKAYLPASEDIGIGTFGSHVKIKTKENNKLRGELISVDSLEVIVLSDLTNKCVHMKHDDIKRMHVQFARGKDYGWIIAGLLTSTLFHGFWVILTFPINFICTTLVAITSANQFKIRSTLIRKEDLKYYARFPGGIPENIDLNTIH